VTNSDWHPFDNGAAIGLPGSEQGIVFRDEEHALGARITLERGAPIAPFAITCGIYGWMMHTCFFRSDDEASTQYEAMKGALAALIDSADKSEETEGGRQILLDGVCKYVETIP
jgi:hypothetical protein